MKFRIFDTHTDETLQVFEAKNIIEASSLAGKWYGADSEDTDLEVYTEEDTMNTNPINSTRYDALQTALRDVADTKWKSLVSIHKTSKFLDNNLTYGVNWSCCGTQEVNKAMDMANHLEEAGNIATFLNDLKLELRYEETEASIDRLLADEKYTTARDYMNIFISILTSELSKDNPNWEDIEEFLLRGNIAL